MIVESFCMYAEYFSIAFVCVFVNTNEIVIFSQHIVLWKSFNIINIKEFLVLLIIIKYENISCWSEQHCFRGKTEKIIIWCEVEDVLVFRAHKYHLQLYCLQKFSFLSLILPSASVMITISDDNITLWGIGVLIPSTSCFVISFFAFLPTPF